MRKDNYYAAEISIVENLANQAKKAKKRASKAAKSAKNAVKRASKAAYEYRYALAAGGLIGAALYKRRKSKALAKRLARMREEDHFASQNEAQRNVRKAALRRNPKP